MEWHDNQELVDYIVQSIYNKFNIIALVDMYQRDAQIYFNTALFKVIITLKFRSNDQQVYISIYLADNHPRLKRDEFLNAYIASYDEIDDIIDQMAKYIRPYQLY